VASSIVVLGAVVLLVLLVVALLVLLLVVALLLLQRPCRCVFVVVGVVGRGSWGGGGARVRRAVRRLDCCHCFLDCMGVRGVVLDCMGVHGACMAHGFDTHPARIQLRRTHPSGVPALVVACMHAFV
jgi:hypothetical protein